MMYYLVYALLFTLSLLPDFILYGIGDVAAFLLCYVFRYRKNVVMENITTAFPEKSLAEKKAIVWKFYRNLAESFMETIIFLNADQKRLEKMFKGNVDLINDLATRVPKIQLHTLHQFNWEVLNLIAAPLIKIPFLVVYMPIANKAIGRVFMKLRTRFGTHLINAKHFRRDFLKYEKSSYVLTLVADQSPGSPKHGYWLNFFGRPTPFVTGPEKSAILNKSAIVFAEMIRVKRGVYSASYQVLTENAAGFPKGEITRRYVQFCEEAIRRSPDNYLWSHRRWKYQYKNDYSANVLEPIKEV